jgi:DNA repair protein RecO
MKTIRTKAIVLRRTNYGEADRILQILTPDSGKISVIARGVRKEKSKLAGGIELFARCDVTIGQGKGDLAILTGARSEVFYRRILEDYDRLQFGYDVIKQISKTADQLDEPAFFELCDQALAALDDFEIGLGFIKTWFWLQLGILLGTGLNLATDTNGMKLVEGARYQFSEHEEGFVFADNGTFSSDHIKLLRILSAQHPRVGARVQAADVLIGECLWLAERTVSH